MKVLLKNQPNEVVNNELLLMRSFNANSSMSAFHGSHTM